MTESNCDHWYLAQLKPGGFARAKLNLERQGFANFMPVRDVTRRRSGQYVKVSRPLFQGYLFVRLPPENTNWRAVNNTYGVSRLVSLEPQKPTLVPARLIAGLQVLFSSERDNLGVDDYELGEKVRVVAGPFADKIAQIYAVLGSGHVDILLEMMGQSVRATVASGNLERT